MRPRKRRGRAVRLEPIHLSEDLVRIKRREQLPLVMAAEMVFDPQGSEDLLEELCRIAVDCGSELAGAARILSGTSRRKRPPSFGPFLKSAGIRRGRRRRRAGRGAERPGLFPLPQPAAVLCTLRAAQLAAYLDPCAVRGAGILPGVRQPAGDRVAGRRGAAVSVLQLLLAQVAPATGRCAPSAAAGTKQACSTSTAKKKRSTAWTPASPAANTSKRWTPGSSTAAPTPPLEQIASLHLDLKASEAGYDTRLPHAARLRMHSLHRA
ncbi:MAG: hypothetical protein MZV70_55970 [Desulfobacterales bacterium]|nr:hypothetical protein [Desulfobacterales bacterium]